MKRKENKLTEVLISLDSDHQKTMLTNLGMSMNPSTDADTIYNIGSTLLSAGYPVEAYKLISRTATNHLPSLTKKADMLLNGVGTERDAAGALKYYKKAAEVGDIWSHIKIAVLLEIGADNVEVNHEQAKEYLNKINNNLNN